MTICFAALCVFLGRSISASQLQQQLSELGSWAPFVYIVLFTVLPAFFFPVAVLALAGGLVFGLWQGAVYTFIGAIINCALMFLLSRYIGREKTEAYVQKNLSPLWQQRLSQSGGRRGFFLLIILRLIPAVPYNLINYAFGLTAMPLGTYLLGSALGIIPGTFAFINIGDKALSPGSSDFWAALGMLAALTIITTLVGKFCFPKETQNEKP